MELKKILSDEAIEISELEKLMDQHIFLTITNIDGVILYANQKFLELFGYRIEEVLGNNHSMFKSGSHSHAFYEQLWETVLNKKTWHGAIKNQTKNGHNIWLKTTIFPIMKNNIITHFASIRNDMTENVTTTEMLQVAQNALKNQNIDLEKELEQNKIFMKQQRFSVIGELASKMAHDLRNPLSVIKAGLENIAMTQGTGDSTATFQRINSAVDRMAHQIEDVLDFVKNKKLEKEFVDVNEIITEAITLQNIPKNISIKKDVECTIIYCDYVMLCTALKNLIHNAIHACNEQGIIKIKSYAKNNDVFISIIDSGDGISEKNMARIFEPLFTTKQKGTGLGLPSVKSIIEQHGGTISFKNNPTTFALSIPLSDKIK